MAERPILDKPLTGKVFRDFYYQKEELVAFCRKYQLPALGGKAELTERIACFLDTGKVLSAPSKKKRAPKVEALCETTRIESDFVCSEKHRAFFKEKIGHSFSFNVAFQKWLKNNAGKTYRDAIEAYALILQAKKTTKTVIDKQFEYNTCIRDFFADNKGRTLEEAIACWKYKRDLRGDNRYEASDLKVL